MSQTRENVPPERQRMKAKYGDLFDSIAALLFRDDPMGINFEINPGEYEPEAGTILPRLPNCESAKDVERVVREEFVRWFGEATAGPKDCYASIAAAIWELWQQHLRSAG